MRLKMEAALGVRQNSPGFYLLQLLALGPIRRPDTLTLAYRRRFLWRGCLVVWLWPGVSAVQQVALAMCSKV